MYTQSLRYSCVSYGQKLLSFLFSLVIRVLLMIVAFTPLSVCNFPRTCQDRLVGRWLNGNGSGSRTAICLNGAIPSKQAVTVEGQGYLALG